MAIPNIFESKSATDPYSPQWMITTIEKQLILVIIRRRIMIIQSTITMNSIDIDKIGS